MFAHVNYVYLQNELVPREVYFSPVQKRPSFIKGFSVDVDYFKMTTKDHRLNTYLRDDIHGMSIVPSLSDVDLDELKDHIDELVGKKKIFVNGKDQEKCLEKFFSGRIVNTYTSLKHYTDLDYKMVPFSMVDVDHLSKCHDEPTEYTCSQFKCYMLARTLYVILRDR